MLLPKAVRLEPARLDDLTAFIELLESAARWMVAQGVEQWLPGSFAAQRPFLEAAARAGDLLVVRGPEGLLAGGVLGDHDHGGVWAPSAGHVAYLSKLVVAQAERGRELGQDVLEECERLALLRGADHLRLDCVATNDGLVRYYQAAGYYPRGDTSAFGTTVRRFDKRLTPLADVRVGSLDGVSEGDWHDAVWATLMFVRRNREVLLIHKKRGHGQGKINGPGGKVEVGESPLACAVRETAEEVGIGVHDATPVAQLRFQDTDGSRMLGFVYLAGAYVGQAIETDEAQPFWCEVDELPFGRMWDDDRVWLPRALRGDALCGEFLMHEDRLVAHRLRDVDRQVLIEDGNRTRT